MRITPVAIVLVILAAFAPRDGRADILPPPGEMERMFQTMIEKAGYSCAKVLSFETATARDRAGANMPAGADTAVVECAERKSYLVAWRFHLRAPPPDVHMPVVKPISD